MSKMFPVYNRELWEALAGTITAGSSRTTWSTYAEVPSDSTGAIGAFLVGSTTMLCYVAFDPPTNRTYTMYWYQTTT